MTAEFTVRCQEYQEQKEAAKDKDASKPDGFKKLINWALWNESFQNYLRQILSAAKIPLIYLTRDDIEAPGDVLLDQADFGSHTKYLIEATTLEGRHYELDNPRFYCKLLSFVVNGEGWSYIKKFERSQDGRSAYLALKMQCEGTASKLRLGIGPTAIHRMYLKCSAMQYTSITSIQYYNTMAMYSTWIYQ